LLTDRSRRLPRAAGLHPVDVILLLAAAEADMPKLEEARRSPPLVKTSAATECTAKHAHILRILC
jgi:hypothetical protein